MICPSCKNPVRKNDSICEWCGFVLSKSQNQETNSHNAISSDNQVYQVSNSSNLNTQPKKSRIKLFIILIISAFLITGLIVYIVEENSRNSYPDEFEESYNSDGSESEYAPEPEYATESEYAEPEAKKEEPAY
jgi:hypothetical protein